LGPVPVAPGTEVFPLAAAPPAPVPFALDPDGVAFEAPVSPGGTGFSFAISIVLERDPVLIPGSFSDTARFGSGEITKRPRASPTGIATGSLGEAGIGVRDNRFCFPFVASEDSSIGISFALSVVLESGAGFTDSAILGCTGSGLFSGAGSGSGAGAFAFIGAGNSIFRDRSAGFACSTGGRVGGRRSFGASILAVAASSRAGRAIADADSSGAGGASGSGAGFGLSGRASLGRSSGGRETWGKAAPTSATCTIFGKGSGGTSMGGFSRSG